MWAPRDWRFNNRTSSPKQWPNQSWRTAGLGGSPPSRNSVTWCAARHVNSGPTGGGLTEATGIKCPRLSREHHRNKYECGWGKYATLWECWDYCHRRRRPWLSRKQGTGRLVSVNSQRRRYSCVFACAWMVLEFKRPEPLKGLLRLLCSASADQFPLRVPSRSVLHTFPYPVARPIE